MNLVAQTWNLASWSGQVESAVPSDAPGIEALIASRSPETIPQPRRRIARNIRRFRVIRSGAGAIIACVALLPIAPGRFEVRSVAVARGWDRMGLGRRLIQWATEEANKQRIQLACVSTKPRFFGRFGFVEADMSSVPPKPERNHLPVAGTRQAMSFVPATLHQESR